jgi:microcystin degradation protein MlrC
LRAQSTRQNPAARLYAECRALELGPGVASADITLGFPPADVAFCGPVVMVTGTAPDVAANRLLGALHAAEPEFALPLPNPVEAVREALAVPHRPVVIADTQDNPGAGGSGDTVGLLRALLEADPPDAVLALLHDPEAARQAHAVGEGAAARFRLGAHSLSVREVPIEAEFTVERLTGGAITAVGPMYRGNHWDIGRTALVRRRGVRVLVAERRLQAADTALLRHAGIEPALCGIVALKSTVHFRAEWEDIAARIIVCAAPGLHLADLRAYPYRKVPSGMRRMPLAV